MGEDTACKNGRISDFQGIVTLTLDQVILHTSTYIPNFVEIKESFCGWTDIRTNGWPTLLGPLGGVDLMKGLRWRTSAVATWGNGRCWCQFPSSTQDQSDAGGSGTCVQWETVRMVPTNQQTTQCNTVHSPASATSSLLFTLHDDK